jgi:hypothetical protein
MFKNVDRVLMLSSKRLRQTGGTTALQWVKGGLRW